MKLQQQPVPAPVPAPAPAPARQQFQRLQFQRKQAEREQREQRKQAEREQFEKYEREQREQFEKYEREKYDQEQMLLERNEMAADYERFEQMLRTGVEPRKPQPPPSAAGLPDEFPPLSYADTVKGKGKGKGKLDSRPVPPKFVREPKCEPNPEYRVGRFINPPGSDMSVPEAYVGALRENPLGLAQLKYLQMSALEDWGYAPYPQHWFIVATWDNRNRHTGKTRTLHGVLTFYKTEEGVWVPAVLDTQVLPNGAQLVNIIGDNHPYDKYVKLYALKMTENRDSELVVHVPSELVWWRDEQYHRIRANLPATAPLWFESDEDAPYHLMKSK